MRPRACACPEDFARSILDVSEPWTCTRCGAFIAYEAILVPTDAASTDVSMGYRILDLPPELAAWLRGWARRSLRSEAAGVGSPRDTHYFLPAKIRVWSTKDLATAEKDAVAVQRSRSIEWRIRESGSPANPPPRGSEHLGREPLASVVSTWHALHLDSKTAIAQLLTLAEDKLSLAGDIAVSRLESGKDALFPAISALLDDPASAPLAFRHLLGVAVRSRAPTGTEMVSGFPSAQNMPADVPAWMARMRARDRAFAAGPESSPSLKSAPVPLVRYLARQLRSLSADPDRWPLLGQVLEVAAELGPAATPLQDDLKELLACLERSPEKSLFSPMRSAIMKIMHRS
ncbi:MAG: hypothetical protein ABIP89_24390 [Polyangiaceae bacterium]